MSIKIFTISKIREEMMKNIIENGVKKAKNSVNSISSSYEKYIRINAIEKVQKRLEVEKINKEDISEEDFEAMVNDACKDIKEKYSKRVSQGLIAIMGIDFLLG